MITVNLWLLDMISGSLHAIISASCTLYCIILLVGRFLLSPINYFRNKSTLYRYVLKYLNLFGLVYGNSCTSLLPLT
jgi:hypothetical protein